MSEQKQSGFGAKLRQLREAAGLTQEALAEQTGMHKFGIAKLERGEREPAWATVRTLAKALGVNCLAFDVEDVPAIEQPARPRGRPPKTPDTDAPPSATVKRTASEKPAGMKGKGMKKLKEKEQ